MLALMATTNVYYLPAVQFVDVSTTLCELEARTNGTLELTSALYR